VPLAAPQQAEQVGALDLPLEAKAKTIVYVHGLANKPKEEILKGQWDRALFGFDLGERSRMAYWVNRARYGAPLGETADPDEAYSDWPGEYEPVRIPWLLDPDTKA